MAVVSVREGQTQVGQLRVEHMVSGRHAHTWSSVVGDRGDLKVVGDDGGECLVLWRVDGVSRWSAPRRQSHALISFRLPLVALRPKLDRKRRDNSPSYSHQSDLEPVRPS